MINNFEDLLKLIEATPCSEEEKPMSYKEFCETTEIPSVFVWDEPDEIMIEDIDDLYEEYLLNWLYQQEHKEEIKELYSR